MTANMGGSVELLLSDMRLLTYELRRAAATHPNIPSGCGMKIASSVRNLTRSRFPIAHNVQSFQAWSDVDQATVDIAATAVIGRIVAHELPRLTWAPQGMPWKREARRQELAMIDVPSELRQLAALVDVAQSTIDDGRAIDVLAKFVEPTTRLRHALHSIHIPTRVIRASVQGNGVVTGDVFVDDTSETVRRLVSALTIEKGPEHWAEDWRKFSQDADKHMVATAKRLHDLSSANRSRYRERGSPEYRDGHLTFSVDYMHITVRNPIEMAEINLVPVPNEIGIATFLDNFRRAHPSTISMAFDLTRSPSPFRS